MMWPKQAAQSGRAPSDAYERESGSFSFRPILRPVASAILLGGLVLVASPGCDGDEGIGDPCTPEKEYDPHFLDFDSNEVYTESRSFQCRTRLCLVNHFQGRVTCPYGQSADGTAPAGTDKRCTVPASPTPISGQEENGTFLDPLKKSTVRPQCRDRTADKAVYCSCRCADINGNRPSDQTFCDCPDGFSCQRLVSATSSAGNEGLTGSYCIKNNTEFDSASSCTEGNCNPANHDCD